MKIRLGVLELAAWWSPGSTKNYSDKKFLWIKDRSTKWLFSKVSKQFSILVKWSTKVHFCDRYPLKAPHRRRVNNYAVF